MKKVFLALALVCLTVNGMPASVDSAQDKPQVPPPWVYTVNPPPTPGATPAPVDPAPKQVPGSTVTLTVAQTRDAYNPPDWHPYGHPEMPRSGRAWPAAGDARVRVLSSRQRPGPS